MDIKPLLIAKPIAKNGSIKFLLPGREIELSAEVAEKAWMILEHCNGINSVYSIVEAVKGIDAAFVEGFLNDLQTLGVVIDSRRYYKHFHAISSNPMVYSSDITNDEIAAHVASPRLAVKSGVGFTFERDTSSTLRKLQELRMSCRSFTGEPLTTSQVGNLLDVGYALDRHAVASAGGLYPMKVFVIALEDQEDFPAGYYEYDNENSRLVLYSDNPDPQHVHYAFNDTEMPFGGSVVFVIAADENRQPRKYSNRGYRFMAIEAGEITTFEEAVNRGILELVERDALMRHWLEKTRPRQVSANALPIHLQNRAAYWQERGRSVFVLDLSQRGVIVTAVVITSDEYPCFVSGASSTLGKFEGAAIKAFHEAESRLIYGLNETNPHQITPAEVHSILDHEFLYAQSRDFHGHLQFLFDGLRSDIVPVASSTFSTLARDLEIVTVDVSEEGAPLKVVKILSEKLVPISFGFGADHYTHQSLRRSGDAAPSVPHFFA